VRILAEGTDGSIETLVPERFDLETTLQQMLADHPELALAGTVDDESMTIWTIGEEVSTAAGSIDLLLLDSTARLWVVETKLARNPDVKKQVVGQVLGYASCVAEWSADQLLACAAEYLAQRGLNIEALTDENDSDPDTLLQTAADRAADGDLACLVAVDEIPGELQRLVEFVNRNARFELLALKIEVARHADRRLFIPTVAGRLADRQSSASGKRATRQWDEPSFLDELAKNHPNAVSPAGRLLEWAKNTERLEISWGSGAKYGKAIMWTWVDKTRDDWVQVFNVSTGGWVGGGWVWRGRHQHDEWWHPFPQEIEALSGTPQSLDKARGFPIELLDDPETMNRFQGSVISLLDRIPRP
jgi:hypothetical protein